MKNKYTKPTMEVVLIKGGQSFLTGSSGEGFNATISGYEADDSDGFSQ